MAESFARNSLPLKVVRSSPFPTALPSKLSSVNNDESVVRKSQKAPLELIVEFLINLIHNEYENAAKLCEMILIYEPNNATAQEFLPLIKEKIAIDKALFEEDENDNSENDETDNDESTESDDETKDDSSSEGISEGTINRKQEKGTQESKLRNHQKSPHRKNKKLRNIQHNQRLVESVNHHIKRISGYYQKNSPITAEDTDTFRPSHQKETCRSHYEASSSESDSKIIIHRSADNIKVIGKISSHNPEITYSDHDQEKNGHTPLKNTIKEKRVSCLKKRSTGDLKWYHQDSHQNLNQHSRENDYWSYRNQSETSSSSSDQKLSIDKCNRNVLNVQGKSLSASYNGIRKCNSSKENKSKSPKASSIAESIF